MATEADTDIGRPQFMVHVVVIPQDLSCLKHIGRYDHGRTHSGHLLCMYRSSYVVEASWSATRLLMMAIALSRLSSVFATSWYDELVLRSQS
jgi:hypothetical protein